MPNIKTYLSSICLKCLLVVMCLLGIVPHASAQNPIEELKKVRDIFYKASTYSADLEYNYYETYTSKVCLEKLIGKYARNGKSHYAKIGLIESITTPHYILGIDHEDKTIELLDRQYVGDPAKTLGPIKLDSLIELTNEARYVTKTSSVAVIEIESYLLEYEKMHIYFSPSTYQIQKMVLFFDMQYEEELQSFGNETEIVEKETTAPRVEVVYKNVKVNEPLPDYMFSYEKYMTQVGTNKFICKPEYKAYTIE